MHLGEELPAAGLLRETRKWATVMMQNHVHAQKEIHSFQGISERRGLAIGCSNKTVKYRMIS